MSDHDKVSSGGNSGNTSDSDGYGSYEGYATSIDYCYSEEETYYVSENDDTGDENRSASQDECVDKTEQRVPDSKMDRKPLTYVDFYAKEVDGFKLTKPPSKRNWIRTWPTTSNQAVVSVYCFFNQFEGFGGYAVIVRNMTLTPVAASVKFTRSAQTYLDEVLMGLEAGLDLALKHGCSSPSVLCNSRLVVRLLSKVAEGCHCESTTVSAICQICTMKIVPHMDPLYFTRLVPLIETLQGKRGSSTFEWDSGKNEAAHCLAKLIKLNALYEHIPFYEEVMEKPEDFPDGVVNVLYRDAFPIRYYTLYREIQVPKASTGVTSEDALDNLLSKANGSNSNITSSAGTEVILPTREEVTGVKSMAEKGQGGDEVVNSSAEDEKGGKTISVGDSIAFSTAVVSAKGKTNTIGSAVVEKSLEEMKDGKAVEDSATVEANEDSSGWIQVKGKKKKKGKQSPSNEGKKSPSKERKKSPSKKGKKSPSKEGKKSPSRESLPTYLEFHERKARVRLARR